MRRYTKPKDHSLERAIGRYIRTKRKEKHMTSVTLSNGLMMYGLDVSDDRICRCEKGRLRFRVDELVLIAHLLDITQDDLLNLAKKHLEGQA